MLNRPDIVKMRILSDIAPYSREYQKYAARVRKQAENDDDLRVEYQTISEQVRQTKESTLQVAKRHFNAPVETIEGTVKSANSYGVKLAEYPGRLFHFSSVGGSMADLTASILGAHNQMTKDQAVQQAGEKIDERADYLADVLAEGTRSLPGRRI